MSDIDFLDETPTTGLGMFEQDPHRSDLLDRYRRQSRSEPCVCGGVIVAMENDDAIRLAVRTHQATIQHQAWWAQVYW